MNETLKKLNITTLNPMQLASVGANQNHNNVVLLAPTGSGKTLAFLLPLLSIINAQKKGTQVLIIAPARELAIQIEQVFKNMQTGYKVNCCYGGHSTKTERDNLLEAPTVLIATPGRLCHHIRKKTIDLQTIETLIVDEFDKCLEFGFQEDMVFISKQLVSLKKRILTSATNNIEIPSFIEMANAITLNYFTKESVSSKLELQIVKTEHTEKLETLLQLVANIGAKPIIIFCNHRDAVDRISDTLNKKGLPHDVFHGGLEQDERERALIKFRNKSCYVLIATDLAARGLDVPEIEAVIHYQLPINEESFIHRNGRTARMNADGKAYILLSDEEKLPLFIPKNTTINNIHIGNYSFTMPLWKTLYISAGKKEKINKIDIVGFLTQKGKLSKEEIGMIQVLDHSAYVAVSSKKAEQTIKHIMNLKIKNQKVKITLAM